MDTINRLQFRHHSEIFPTREDAVEYIMKNIRDAEEGMAKNDPTSPYGFSKFAEPTVLRYGTEEDTHVILAIGAKDNDTLWHENNRFCIIDIDKTEQEIVDLWEAIDEAIKSLTIIALSSNTLNLYADKTNDGTFISGDVKTAETHIFDNVVKANNLMVVPDGDPAGPEGLFIYIDLTYDEPSETFTFVVSKADGTLKEQSVKLPNNYVVSGEYKKEDESIILHMRNGDEVVVDCEQLIDEWIVEGEASNTPIVLTREEVGPDGEHHHTEPWQDVLRADVRVADFIGTNILEKSSDGRYLYVDGKATNIIYYYNGEESNVSEQLDKLNKIKISADNDNIIWNRTDGFFATTKLEYISNKNKLIFTNSNVSGGTTTKEIQLNSVELFQNVYYDKNTEELVITYKDNEGNLKVVRIPISDMFEEWDVLNDAHSVKLVKSPHHVSGKDILTADVNISTADNNILVERGEGNVHTLYVRGEADNIKYGRGTVESALDGLVAEDESINEKLDQEIERSTVEDEKIETTIGSGFSTDAHETVTYKFDQLQEQVNSEAEKLQNEVNRAIEKDAELEEALNDEVERATAAENNLQNEIEAVSADSLSSIKEVINNDRSIVVDNTNQTKPVISVNLSEQDGNNTIRLKSDGLYNFVDLEFNSTENKLLLTRSTSSGDTPTTKEIQLDTVSFIKEIDYDPETETLTIIYLSGTVEKSVDIDLKGLIEEWEVYNDPDSAVKLDRQRVIDGKDKLSGKVVITTAHIDNILENDHGALYVPANTDVTRALSGAIITEKDERIDADRNLEDEIQAETTRAQLAESSLSAFTITATNEEKTRAMTAEGELRQAIQDETARANAADQLLQDAIDDEVERSTAKDNEHDSKIAALETSATTLNQSIDNERTRALSAETELSTRITSANSAIQSEVERSTAKDEELTTAINTEKSRAEAAELVLRNNITEETIRANAADAELNGKINDEKSARISGDSSLHEEIRVEAVQREAADGDLSNSINLEKVARENADSTIIANLNAEAAERQRIDNELSDAINNEVAAREAAIQEIDNKVSAATLTFEDTTSIDFTKNGTDVTADVKLQGGDNIIKLGQGLYATATLEYEPTGNKIRLVTSNGAQEYIQLVGATLLDSIEYDPINKMLVIKYTDGTGSQRETAVGVTDLWNEWIVQNPSEKSAVELTKTIGDPGNADTISARVLVTDDRDGDGKPDEGSDNILEIRNNGLYVCGSGNTTAECVSGKTDAIYKALFGTVAPGGCGDGIEYLPDALSCVLSGASSFVEADKLMANQICEILEMWTSGETCTTTSDWIDDGANKKMIVDVKLSRGNTGTMTDDEIVIENLEGDFIDPTRTEFTDTNALRVVCLQDGGGGVIPAVNTPQNGVYLSNVWDCGLYYDEVEDAQAITDAQTAGYITDPYRTDTDASARDYNYMNNVRQNDI